MLFQKDAEDKRGMKRTLTSSADHAVPENSADEKSNATDSKIPKLKPSLSSIASPQSSPTKSRPFTPPDCFRVGAFPVRHLQLEIFSDLLIPILVNDDISLREFREKYFHQKIVAWAPIFADHTTTTRPSVTLVRHLLELDAKAAF